MKKRLTATQVENMCAKLIKDAKALGEIIKEQTPDEQGKEYAEEKTCRITDMIAKVRNYLLYN